jgi:hypothetical protein
MAKYRVDTDHGSYIVETADDASAAAAPPDAGAQMRASALAGTQQSMDMVADAPPSAPAPPKGFIQSLGDGLSAYNPSTLWSAYVAHMNDPYGTATTSKDDPGGILPATQAISAVQQAQGGDVLGGLGTATAAAVPFVLPEAGKLAGKVVKKVAGAAAELPRQAAGAVFGSRLDPAEAASVAYADAEGIHTSAAERTGNKLLANTERIAQHVPFSSGIAEDARAAGESDLAAAGAREVAGLGAAPEAPSALEVGEAIHAKHDAAIASHAAAGPALVDGLGAAPGAPVARPLDVGEGLHENALQNEKAHGARANDSYAIFRSIEEQPQFKAIVQTGTKEVENGIDEAGNPAFKTVPVTETIQAPTDYRKFKKAVKVMLADALRPMSIAQEQSSTGIKAMRNIVAAPDFVSASVADQDLGALKGIMRDSPQSKSVAQAKFAADMLSKQVDATAQRMGPEAVAALRAGRDATIAKYGAQKFQSDIGFKGVGTGHVEAGSAVDLTNKLTADGDRNISLLRSVRDNAPEHIPHIAQSFGQDVYEHIKAGNPSKAVDAVTGLGAETKKILFPDAAKRAALGEYVRKAAELQAAKDALPGADSLVADATRPKDQNVSVLRAIAKHSPEHMPAMAQAVTQGLIESATAEAGMKTPGAALRKFLNMGDETKNILYRDPFPRTDETGPAAQRVENWLTLAKRKAENPNPSGSGMMVAFMKGVGLALTSPIGVPVLLGARAVTKMLFNPADSKLMTAAMKMPAKSGRPGALLAEKIIAAAGSDVHPLPASPSVVSTSAEKLPPSEHGLSVSDIGRGTGRGEQPLSSGAGGSEGAGNGSVGGKESRYGTIEIPGKPGGGYKYEYKLKELGDSQASHSGLTFQPNPKATAKNVRDYSNQVNQGKIISWSSDKEFVPGYHTQGSTDALNGPPVDDEAGQTIAGHGRHQIQERVYAAGGAAAKALRASVAQRASQIEGLNPNDALTMKRPSLRRVISNSEFARHGPNARENLIADTNVSGTAPLTPAEQTIQDSRRVSMGTLDDIAGRLDKAGAGATVPEALEGKAGGEVLENLIKDGVIAPHQRAAFVDTETGALTKAGSERVKQLLIGRFFSDPAHIDEMAPAVTNKVLAAAAPLVQVESKPAWNLTAHVKDALDILEESRQLGIKSVDDFIQQDSLFANKPHSDETITIAKMLRGGLQRDFTAAARRYAEDASFAEKGHSLFGEAPTPEQSFAEAFKAPEPPAANALAAAPAAAAPEQPANSLAAKPKRAPAKRAPKK